MFFLEEKEPIMLDEDKIRVMTKLAVFEKEEGDKAEIASHYYKGDYVSYNMIWTGINASIAYVLLVGLCLFCGMEQFLNYMQENNIVTFLTILGIIYIFYLVGFEIFSFFFFRKKYNSAEKKVKEYCNGLKELEKIYNKEHLRQTRATAQRNLNLGGTVSHDRFTGI